VNVEREGGVLAWQWRGYSRTHRDRVNLVIHMLTVPAFIAGSLAALTQGTHANWYGAGIAVIVVLAAFALQAASNKRERVAAEPYAGSVDFITRVFAEQYVTFPRFVLMGQWARNLAEGQSR